MKRFLSVLTVIAILSFLVISGCTSNKSTQSAATDSGSSQNSPALATDTGSQPSSTPQTNENPSTIKCPDGTIVKDASSCPKCPASCDDNNPCTQDICSKETAYQCKHVNIDGPQLGCSGPGQSCKEKTCSAGQCTEQEKTPCCGNGKSEIGETCSTCPEDVKCDAGSLCCSDGCRKPKCATNADCNDGDRTTIDTCQNGGTCDASCSNLEIKECKNGDGICPKGCSAFTDSDCPTYGLNQPVDIGEGNGVTMSLDSLQERHCTSDYGSIGLGDYGSVLAVKVTVKNDGSQSSGYISPAYSMRLLDSQGNQYDPTYMLVGETCDDLNSQSYSSGDLMPNTRRSGYVFFELSKKGEMHVNGNLRIVYDPNSFIKGGEVVFSFSK